MDVLRTPDSRFENLPGYDFSPRYLENVGELGLRIHYLDEGPPDAAVTWLCLHGQPTWSYLYRKMIPVFTAAGHRVVAPDLAGFGRSDKPADDAVYSFAFHRNILLELVRRLDLGGVRLVCQDWGGLLGLTLPMEAPGRYAGLLVMNTGLATGDVPLGDGFLAWRAYSRTQQDLDVAALMRRATPTLSESEADAYAAPFPDARFKAGVRRFPELVPEHPDAPGAELSRRARDWWRNEWDRPTLMAVGEQDPVLGPPAMRYLQRQIRGCPEPMMLHEAGHFVQEWGEPIARRALDALV